MGKCLLRGIGAEYFITPITAVSRRVKELQGVGYEQERGEKHHSSYVAHLRTLSGEPPRE